MKSLPWSSLVIGMVFTIDIRAVGDALALRLLRNHCHVLVDVPSDNGLGVAFIIISIMMNRTASLRFRKCYSMQLSLLLDPTWLRAGLLFGKLLIHVSPLLVMLWLYDCSVTIVMCW